MKPIRLSPFTLSIRVADYRRVMRQARRHYFALALAEMARRLLALTVSG